MTGPLKNARHERFAVERVKGLSVDAAYVAAGFKANSGNAARLNGNERVQERIAELQAEAAKAAVIDAAWVLEQAVDLHTKAKAAGAFSPAARALELVGKHVNIQAFREQMQHSGLIEYRNLSDEEIAARIAAHEAARAAESKQADLDYLALLDERARREDIRRRTAADWEAGADARRQLRGEPTASFERTAKQAEQAAAVEGDARHVLAYGGSRSGKTFGFCEIVAERALQAPDSRHLIARLHNIDVRQAVMLDTWPKMMRICFPDVPYRVNKQDQFAVLGDGAEVWFGGLDDKERVEKILGKEFATIYVNESSQVAYATVLTLRTRLAQASYRADGRRLPLKALYDLNPTGRGHWSYREFVEKVRPDNGMPIEPGSRTFVVMNPADNPHLPPEYHAELDGLPDKQRQRFRDGKYLSEVPGALWSSSDRTADDGRLIPGIDTLRRHEHPPLSRIVIGVDPSGSDGTGGDSQGIVVAGLGTDGEGYVLADLSCRLSPDGWARVVARAAKDYGADRVIAEKNFGGAMVEAVLRSADANLPVKLVTASRGKVVRAEPVAALGEQGKTHMVGSFPDLEEQLTMTTTAGFQGAESPDRMDAYVWAFTELMLGGGYTPDWSAL